MEARLGASIFLGEVYNEMRYSIIMHNKNKYLIVILLLFGGAVEIAFAGGGASYGSHDDSINRAWDYAEEELDMLETKIRALEERVANLSAVFPAGIVQPDLLESLEAEVLELFDLFAIEKDKEAEAIREGRELSFNMEVYLRAVDQLRDQAYALKVGYEQQRLDLVPEEEPNAGQMNAVLRKMIDAPLGLIFGGKPDHG